MRNCIRFIGLLLALLGPVRAFAEITMFVSPDGDGRFIVEGDNAQGVEAIEIMIGYDTASLENPRVETQGGIATDVYTGTPGMLNVTVTREDPETTFELYLKFDKKGDSPGVIDYVSATARGKDGRNYAASSDLRALAPEPEKGTDQSGDDYSAGTPSAKTINTDEREKSVLQRFTEFKGDKGLKSFAALFRRGYGERIVQEPAIALSDGKTPVVIKLELQAEGNHSPDVALSGAKLVSVQKVGGKNWIITVLPAEGAWEARLVIGTGKEIIDFPLVVAPPVKMQDSVTEKNFLAALNQYLSDQAVRQTGESGTFRKSFHEYIFTANYLVNIANTIPKK
jgi:hypothetical protein